MACGGRRPGSGRPPRDTVRVSASILRPIYLELVRQEKLTGVYRCQIVGRILTEHLVGGIVDSELKAVVQARPAEQARNGSDGEEPLARMLRPLAGFHW